MSVRHLLACSALALAMLMPALADAQRLIHSERSLYREVLVYEDGPIRCMCFTRNCRIGRQTCMNTEAPNRFVMNYTRMMMTALFLNPQPRSILIIGLGGGTLPQALHRVLPEARIEVVEIDPAVVRVAKRFFGFSTNDRVHVEELDGRVFVKRAQREGRQYDLIMLDAFDHEYIPEHLLTREFLQEVAALLGSQGVLAANTFSSSRLYDHESVTYAAVFGTFYNLKQDNRVILATKGALPERDQIARNAEQLRKAFAVFDIGVEKHLRMFSTTPDWDRRARVLTDQYSPANLLNLRE
ncbi:MAG TPA: fused MFS/spermidine synthase [Steroidobacteraceae bacterium]